MLSHHEQLARLAAAVPHAGAAAVVAGDPCFDRLVASEHLRSAYRSALGVNDDRTMIAVTSTWGRRSLFGSNPDLVAHLAGELDLDNHTVAVILHPNTWYAHSPAQIRWWLGDCLRAGVRLIPPIRGWQQALIASDIVIGDHGSVTGYAAALGRPTLLAEFPDEDVVPTSVIDALGQSTPRLDCRALLQAQLDAARLISPDPQIRALTTSAPGESQLRLRAKFYLLMKLAPPPSSVRVPSYEPDDLEPIHSPLTAWWTATTRDADGNYLVRRWAAEPIARPDRPPVNVERHLVASTTEARRDLSSNAAICIVDDGRGLDDAAPAIFTQHLACSLAVARDGATGCRIRHRDGWSVSLSIAPSNESDPAALASVIYAHLNAGLPWTTIPDHISAVLGTQQIAITVDR
ncbi:hypothetical protein [Kribbella solani]|uniref:hypothetical protein n=1 Tax=Kribbella solani TaxID=236067 RepID=UPI0029A5F08A|nr:hypothetical protein [Kribbella solani]MDX2968596.1 hypothetical protein [Kribbella solani]